MTKEKEDFERRGRDGTTRKFVLVYVGQQIHFVFTLALRNDPITSHLLDQMFPTSHMAAGEEFNFSLPAPSTVNIYQLFPPSAVSAQPLNVLYSRSLRLK